MDYIAVLGYSCFCYYEELAVGAGKTIAERKYGVIVGNTKGTLSFALKGAKKADGETLVIVSKDMNIPENDNWSEMRIVRDKQNRSQRIAKKSIGAIVIGGGPDTEELILKLKELGKPVIGIQGTGGAAEKLELKVSNASEAINIIERQYS